MLELKKTIVAVALVGLSACTSRPIEPAAIQFNYNVDNGKPNGIVQVFDIGGNTVIQMRGLQVKSTEFLDARNAPISYKVMGENVVLSGVHSSFTVLTSFAASRVVRNAPAPRDVQLAATGPEHEVALASIEADRNAKLVAEIARIRKEIAELKGFLAAAQIDDASTPIHAAPPARQPTVIRVRFANNSAAFAPAPEVRSMILSLAKQTEEVLVVGFTDSAKPTAAGERLARARAEAARRYLVAAGVSPKRIKLQYEGAGKFIADNSMREGRAANRRVELAFS